MQSLVARDDAAALEELQGAVEYLLTKVMEARGFAPNVAQMNLFRNE